MSHSVERITIEQLRRRYKRHLVSKMGWDTIRSRAHRPPDHILYCPCPTPRPTRDGMFLRICDTVQCGNCGRAIFTADGAPVRG